MNTYVTIGTNDFERALSYYEELMKILGAKRGFETDRLVMWTTSDSGLPFPGFAVCKPFDGGKATFGNGTMVGIAAGSRENVDKLYARAIELGGTDEGAPAERFPGFYAGYFRDLDGNKLNFFHMG